MKNNNLVASPRLHFAQEFGVFILNLNAHEFLFPFFGHLSAKTAHHGVKGRTRLVNIIQ